MICREVRGEREKEYGKGIRHRGESAWLDDGDGHDMNIIIIYETNKRVWCTRDDDL